MYKYVQCQFPGYWEKDWVWRGSRKGLAKETFWSAEIIRLRLLTTYLTACARSYMHCTPTF